MNKDLHELYSDYLLSAFSSYTTHWPLKDNRLRSKPRQNPRFLSENNFGSLALRRLVKPLVRQKEGKRRREVY